MKNEETRMKNTKKHEYENLCGWHFPYSFYLQFPTSVNEIVRAKLNMRLLFLPPKIVIVYGFNRLVNRWTNLIATVNDVNVHRRRFTNDTPQNKCIHLHLHINKANKS